MTAIVLIWLAAAFFVGYMGTDRGTGFWGAFLLSAFFSPVVGIIIVLLSPYKNQGPVQITSMAGSTKPASNSESRSIFMKPEEKASSTSVTDELSKLFELKEKGAITEEEYQSLKEKALSKP